MKFYSKVMQWLCFVNLLVGVILTIYGQFYPDMIQGGMYMNMVGTLFMFWSTFIMLILLGVFYLLTRSFKIDVQLSSKATILYWILILNLICRFLFNDGKMTENGSSITADKLMAGFALAMYINYNFLFIVTKYIKTK